MSLEDIAKGARRATIATALSALSFFPMAHHAQAEPEPQAQKVQQSTLERHARREVARELGHEQFELDQLSVDWDEYNTVVQDLPARENQVYRDIGQDVAYHAIVTDQRSGEKHVILTNTRGLDTTFAPLQDHEEDFLRAIKDLDGARVRPLEIRNDVRREVREQPEAYFLSKVARAATQIHNWDNVRAQDVVARAHEKLFEQRGRQAELREGSQGILEAMADMSNEELSVALNMAGIVDSDMPGADFYHNVRAARRVLDYEWTKAIAWEDVVTGIMNPSWTSESSTGLNREWLVDAMAKLVGDADSKEEALRRVNEVGTKTFRFAGALNQLTASWIHPLVASYGDGKRAAWGNLIRAIGLPTGELGYMQSETPGLRSAIMIRYETRDGERIVHSTAPIDPNRHINHYDRGNPRSHRTVDGVPVEGLRTLKATLRKINRDGEQETIDVTSDVTTTIDQLTFNVGKRLAGEEFQLGVYSGHGFSFVPVATSEVDNDGRVTYSSVGTNPRFTYEDDNGDLQSDGVLVALMYRGQIAAIPGVLKPNGDFEQADAQVDVTEQDTVHGFEPNGVYRMLVFREQDNGSVGFSGVGRLRANADGELDFSTDDGAIVVAQKYTNQGEMTGQRVYRTVENKDGNLQIREHSR